MSDDFQLNGTDGRARKRVMIFVLLAALLGTAQLALFWPGIAVFDSVNQYGQAMVGRYDDWHPPIMARLWAGMEAIGLHGTAPMLVLQLGALWAGTALCGAALLPRRPAAAWATLLVGLLPIVANWMIVIDKDCGMIAALTAATGLVAWHRLRARWMPRWAVAATILLLGYAMLVRANAAFAAVPLAWSWQGWVGVKRWWLRTALAILTMLAVFGLSAPINHRLLGATASHVENTLPIFDVAGIAHFAALDTVPGIAASRWREVTTRRCYMPFYWDPFADETRCGEVGDLLADDDLQPPLKLLWVETLGTHPIAYAQHRLAHLNATLRIIVPADEPSTSAPPGSQPNSWQIGAARTWRSNALAAAARTIGETPPGAPASWLALAIGLFWVLLGTPDQPAREIGLSLALSSITMTASFAIVSIASDMRYHLWLFVGTCLAGTMLGACDGVPRRRLAIVVGTVFFLCAIEGVARLTMAPFVL